MQPDHQPVVIMGGFLSSADIYTEMRQSLASLSGRSVWVVGAQTVDWLTVISKWGWSHLLVKLDQAVHAALRSSTASKVILVGHSQGGLVSRLYLSPEPIWGTCYHGLDYVSRLITLGSPHNNRGGFARGGRMAEWLESQIPGAAFTPKVEYISVVGKYLRGDLQGSAKEKWAYKEYKKICGDGYAWGDGIVPVPSALLAGAEHIVLEGVSHFSTTSQPWYGTPQVLPRWWS